MQADSGESVEGLFEIVRLPVIVEYWGSLTPESSFVLQAEDIIEITIEDLSTLIK